ncbi:MAG: peptidoglycan-binding protein [Hyphomicrobiales bacterium]
MSRRVELCRHRRSTHSTATDRSMVPATPGRETAGEIYVPLRLTIDKMKRSASLGARRMLLATAAIVILSHTVTAEEPGRDIADRLKDSLAKPVEQLLRFKGWLDGQAGPIGDNRKSEQPAQAPNSRIIELQRQLGRLGYYFGPVDGDFGPMTASAMNAFQRQNGIAETAEPTDELLDVLIKTEKAPSAPRLDQASYRELQSRLAKEGFDPGVADGIAGPQTKSAIARFLQRSGKQSLDVDELGDEEQQAFLALDLLRAGRAPGRPVLAEAEPTIAAQAVLTLAGDGSAMYKAAISADGRRVIGATQAGEIVVWDVAAEARLGVIVADGGEISAMGLADNGAAVVALSTDGKLRVWDAESGVLTASYEVDGAKPVGLAFAANHGQFAVTWSDDRLRLYDVADASVERPIGWATTPAQFYAGDQALLAGLMYQNDVQRWTLPDAAEKEPLSLKNDGISTSVTRVAVNPQGSLLAATGLDGMIWLIDLRDPKAPLFLVPEQLPVQVGADPSFQVMAWRQSKDPRFRAECLQFSPDGQVLAACYNDGNLAWWRVGDHRAPLSAEAQGFKSPLRLYAAAWEAPSGLDPSTFQQIMPEHGAGRQSGPLLFGHGGDYLISRAEAGTLLVWDVSSGARLAELGAKGATVIDFAVDRSGETIAAAQNDGNLTIWRLTKQ